jgi:hypothetical protein
MKREPIKIPRICGKCKDETALRLAAALLQLKLLDEDGEEMHLRALDDSIMVWFGDDEPEEASRPRQNFPM